MTVYRGIIISYYESVDTVRGLNSLYIRATELSVGVPESARCDLSNGGIESFRGVPGRSPPRGPPGEVRREMLGPPRPRSAYGRVQGAEPPKNPGGVQEGGAPPERSGAGRLHPSSHHPRLPGPILPSSEAGCILGGEMGRGPQRGERG